jgi:hypothetical protein
MSALTDRLSEDDLRELAALLRRTHARTAARLERERLERGQQENETGESTGDGHGGAAAERGEGP